MSELLTKLTNEETLKNIYSNVKAFDYWEWENKEILLQSKASETITINPIRSISWWEIVLGLLIFLIENWISDLHIEANNSIVYRIRYRKDKKLFLLK